MWFEKKKKFIEGVTLISSKLSDKQFKEEAAKKFNETDVEFSLIEIEGTSPEESALINKSLLYIVQRLKKYLLSPVRLYSDLNDLGLSQEKSEIIVGIYTQYNRAIMRGLKTDDSSENVTNVAWQIKTTLFDEVNGKMKKPAARLCFEGNNQEMILEDMTHSELSVIFNDFEAIQRELDVLAAK